VMVVIGDDVGVGVVVVIVVVVVMVVWGRTSLLLLHLVV